MPLPWEGLGVVRKDRKAEGEELRRLRAALGLTQERAALALDVSGYTYHRWENAAAKCPWAVLELMRRWVREAEASRGRRGRR